MPAEKPDLQEGPASATAPCPLHEANRRRWDAGARGYAERGDRRGVWRRCAHEPELVFDPKELAWLRDVAGKRVCVLGSGDNEAVFALAGLGALVTSVDISEAQLEVAAERARQLGLAVTFLRADVCDLTALADGAFDLVYTGGHVNVWVSDVRRYYAEAARILVPDGLLMVSEYHPFRRGWRETKERLERACGYFERGPHEYDCSGEISGAAPGSLPTYEFHWTVGDCVMAVKAAGCDIELVDEFGDEPEEWECAALTGLPRILLIIGRKQR